MSLQSAIMESQQAMAMGMLPSMESIALVQDYEMGRQREKMVEKVCKTLEYAYQYQIDRHRPEFKEQMKQLVRRVIICKVGYVKIRICRGEYDTEKVSTMETPSDAKSRALRAQ